MEILAPAGSRDALDRAIAAGADAVYLGYGPLNARRNAKNFSQEELRQAVSYCHQRGTKVYLTLNTLLSNRELPLAAETAAFASEIGIDAILVQDLGVARLLRETVPDVDVHASTQMTVHNLDGVKACADFNPVLPVIAHIVAAERKHSHRVTSYNTYRACCRSGCFGAHNRAYEYAVIPAL